MNSPFIGKWSYRSFLRNPDLSVDFNELRFGAGLMEFSTEPFGVVKGLLGGTGWSLALDGRCSFGNPNEISFQGKGDIGGELWVYDYLGYLSPAWPNGIDERPAIIGSIVRTMEHSGGNSPAGVVASWIAIKQ